MAITQIGERRDMGVLLAVVGGILFLGTAGFLGYQYYVSKNAADVFNPLMYYADMRGTFEEAGEAALLGELEIAQEVYTDLLATANDQTVIEQTRLKMMRTAIGISAEEGARLAKELAADELINPQIRAGAMSEIGARYMSDALPDAIALSDAFFTGDPYAAMREGTDAAATEAAYMKLFEYANTISPTLLATAYLAEYRAQKYWESANALGVEEATVVSLQNSASTTIAELEMMIERTPDTSPHKPVAWVLLGTAELYLGIGQTEAEAHISKGLELYGSIRTFLEAGLQDLGKEPMPESDGRGYFDEIYLKNIVLDAETELQGTDL